MTIEDLLIDELDADFETLRTEKDSEKCKAATDTLVKLLDRKIEMDKIEVDRKNKEATLEMERDFRERQMKEERTDRLVKNIIGAAGIVLPLVVTIWGTVVSLKFEEEGTFTTIMGRGFIQKLLPRK